MNERIINLGKAIFSGRFLLALHFDKYLDRIVYLFAMALMFIWINIQIDKTLHHKEQNSKILENLQSLHTDTVCRLTALNSVCEVEKMLQDMGSNVQIPQKKAKTIK